MGADCVTFVDNDANPGFSLDTDTGRMTFDDRAMRSLKILDGLCEDDPLPPEPVEGGHHRFPRAALHGHDIELNAFSAAARVSETWVGPWAVETNAASNWDGARYTPSASIARKKFPNRAVSDVFALSQS